MNSSERDNNIEGWRNIALPLKKHPTLLMSSANTTNGNAKL